MTTTIYYFSATGNTLFIAKELAKRWGNSELIPISSLHEGMIETESDRVGFLFPVYFYGIPEIVCKFIQRFQQRQGQYCFGVAVHGGEPGNALYQLDKVCRAANIRLSYMKDIYTAGGWIVLYKPERPEDFKYSADMQSKVRIIADEVSVQKTDFSGIRFQLILRAVYILGFPIFKKGIRRFSVKSSCIGCGKCTKICPVKNIALINGKPIWRHPCEHCLACLHWCPKSAIEYGNSTVGKNRYVNPFVKVDELFVKLPGGVKLKNYEIGEQTNEAKI